MKISMIMFLLHSLLLACCMPALAATTINSPDEVSFAHEQYNAFPWVFEKNGLYVGLDVELLTMVSQQLGVKARFKPFPWVRALSEMRYGAVNAVFASSYKKEREDYGLYPMSGGELDTTKSLHLSGYSLYILKNERVDFDGKRFSLLSLPIGVQRGFSIVGDLEPFNVQLSENTDDPQKILQQLYRGRISAAALQTQRADMLIAEEPLLKESVIKLQIEHKPFQQKPYFVMFSKQFMAKYPEFTQLFWDTLQQVQTSPEFIQKVKLFNQEQ